MTDADLAGVLFVAVLAMFAGSILFTLIWLPRIIRAVHDQYEADEQAAAEASGGRRVAGDPAGVRTPHPRRAHGPAAAGRAGRVGEAMICTNCGDRCDICDERMCSEYGPEPAPTCGAHQECVDCVVTNPCRECAAARREGLA